MITPQEMQKRSVKAQIKKFGSKELYKADMKRRSLLATSLRKSSTDSKIVSIKSNGKKNDIKK